MSDDRKTDLSEPDTTQDLLEGEPGLCSYECRPWEGQDACRRAIDQLMTAFDATDDGVLITRLRDETILDVNDRFVLMLGHPRAGVLGRPAVALDLWIDTETHQTFLKTLRKRLECSGMETSFKTRNGDVIPVIVSGRVVELGGEPCVVTFARDVSVSDRTAQGMHRSEERYRQLVESANDAIYMTDAKGKFTFVNPAALRISGHSEEELIGKYYLDLIHPDYRQQAEEFYRSQFNRKVPSTYYEFPVVTKDGEEVWLGQSVQVVLDNDAVAGFRAICRDITERKRTEEHLFRSERRFRLLSEAAPFGISVMRNDRKFRYHNLKFTEIFGYTIGDVPDKDTWFLKAYPDEEYRKRVIAVWTEDTQGSATPGEVSPRIFSVRCKDGSDKIIQFRAVVMEHGWQILTYEDITLQAKSAQALHESETKYRSLFEAANDAIFLMRGEYFIDCNARALDMFGSPKEQVFGESLLNFSPERQPDGGHSRARALEFIDQALLGQKQIFHWRCARRNGSGFDAEVSLSRMELSGEMVLLLIVRDITDRVRAQKALRESEQMLTNILAASPVGISRLDERTIRWANEAMVRMFGFDSAEELIERTTRELYASPEEYDRVGARLYEDSMPRTESETYARLVRKDGSIFDGHVRISAPDPLDRTKGTIAVFSDVSKLREAEKAKAIAEHTAEVAHELRQPLAIIGGFARRMFTQLQNGPSMDIERHKESFQIIAREVKRLEEILRGLIDFSRRRMIQLKSVDPNEIVRKVIRVHEERFEERNLQLESHFNQEVGEVCLDENRFEQVVRNLVSNAIEASADHGVVRVDTGIFTPSAKARTTGEFDAEHYFELKVHNGGKAVSCEQLHRLFEPFYTTKEDGVGMGLTLSKKIVEEHRGSISVKSDQGGTVFTVWIPLASAPPVSPVEPDSS